jgi:hypothetical protein
MKKKDISNIIIKYSELLNNLNEDDEFDLLPIYNEKKYDLINYLNEFEKKKSENIDIIQYVNIEFIDLCDYLMIKPNIINEIMYHIKIYGNYELITKAKIYNKISNKLFYILTDNNPLLYNIYKYCLIFQFKKLNIKINFEKLFKKLNKNKNYKEVRYLINNIHRYNINMNYIYFKLYDHESTKLYIKLLIKLKKKIIINEYLLLYLSINQLDNLYNKSLLDLDNINIDDFIITKRYDLLEYFELKNCYISNDCYIYLEDNILNIPDNIIYKYKLYETNLKFILLNKPNIIFNLILNKNYEFDILIIIKNIIKCKCYDISYYDIRCKCDLGKIENLKLIIEKYRNKIKQNNYNYFFDLSIQINKKKFIEYFIKMNNFNNIDKESGSSIIFAAEQENIELLIYLKNLGFKYDENTLKILAKNNNLIKLKNYLNINDKEKIDKINCNVSLQDAYLMFKYVNNNDKNNNDKNYNKKDLEDLEEFEKINNFKFPDDLRYYLLNISNFIYGSSINNEYYYYSIEIYDYKISDFVKIVKKKYNNNYYYYKSVNNVDKKNGNYYEINKKSLLYKLFCKYGSISNAIKKYILIKNLKNLKIKKIDIKELNIYPNFYYKDDILSEIKFNYKYEERYNNILSVELKTRLLFISNHGCTLNVFLILDGYYKGKLYCSEMYINGIAYYNIIFDSFIEYIKYINKYKLLS